MRVRRRRQIRQLHAFLIHEPEQEKILAMASCAELRGRRLEHRREYHDRLAPQHHLHRKFKFKARNAQIDAPLEQQRKRALEHRRRNEIVHKRAQKLLLFQRQVEFERQARVMIVRIERTPRHLFKLEFYAVELPKFRKLEFV